MASKIVDRGLAVYVGRASSTADAFAALQSLSVDDSVTAFAAAHTALNTGGAVANFLAVAYDATPTRAAQAVTHTATIPAGSFNGNTIRRIALHNVAFGSVTASSVSLIGGVDGQTFAKTADFAMTFRLVVTLTDNS